MDRLLPIEAELSGANRIAQQFSNAFGQIGRIERPMEQAAAGVEDHFGEAAVVGEHDWYGVGHCFEGRESFRFAVYGWCAEDIERLQELDFFCPVELADVFEPAGEWTGARAGLKFFEVGAVAFA
jgi:hypothetical protein